MVLAVNRHLLPFLPRPLHFLGNFTVGNGLLIFLCNSSLRIRNLFILFVFRAHLLVILAASSICHISPTMIADVLDAFRGKKGDAIRNGFLAKD